jgi:hypothetical protein
VIEHVLQVSKQLFFIIYDFLNFCGDEQVSEYTIIAKRYKLARKIPHTLMRFSLLFELASKLGVSALQTGPLPRQFVNAPFGFFQPGGLLLGLLARILLISSGLR